MTGYSSDRNAVEIFFEISRLIPQTITIYERVDLEWVRGQVKESPFITLRDLSDLIHQQFGVIPSISHMLRIQQLAGISRITGSRAKQVTRLQANSKDESSFLSQGA